MTAKEEISSGVVVTTAVATPIAAPVAATTDVEAQKPTPNAATAAASATASNDEFDPQAGKTLGITMFILLLVALICTFIFPLVSFVALIATIVIASSITCNCCCASDLSFHPQRKKFATATLVSLCMMFIVQLIWLIAAATAVGTQASNTGTISQRTVDATTTSAIIIFYLSLAFNGMAIIFSALFNWKRC